MEHRITRINNLIQETMSDLLKREISLKKGVFVTIPHVDTTRDLRYTRIFVSVFPSSETDYCMKTLSKEKKMLQKGLWQKLSMKPLPKIDFILDTSEEGADEIERILREIHGEL